MFWYFWTQERTVLKNEYFGGKSSSKMDKAIIFFFAPGQPGFDCQHLLGPQSIARSNPRVKIQD